jgi:hypothetical protein
MDDRRGICDELAIKSASTDDVTSAVALMEVTSLRDGEAADGLGLVAV